MFTKTFSRLHQRDIVILLDVKKPYVTSESDISSGGAYTHNHVKAIKNGDLLAGIPLKNRNTQLLMPTNAIN